MKTQPESVNVPKAMRPVHDDTRPNNADPLTVHVLRLRDVFVTHSRSTR
jgi:hypothetical protein